MIPDLIAWLHSKALLVNGNQSLYTVIPYSINLLPHVVVEVNLFLPVVLVGDIDSQCSP